MSSTPPPPPLSLSASSSVGGLGLAGGARLAVGAVDEDGFGASIAWTFGENTAKLQYLAADIWRTTPQFDPLDNRLETLLSVGLDHALGDSTKLFGFYTTGDIGGTSENDEYTAIGIEHNF